MSSRKAPPVYVRNGQALSRCASLTEADLTPVKSLADPLSPAQPPVDLHPQFDSQASAQSSQFNIHNRNTAYRNSTEWGARTSSSSSNVRRGGEGGGGPRIGRVDDVRGPECKSCR
ncbi:hypothetical protein PoHVEF18_005114 [Penicillium ochrochloron]